MATKVECLKQLISKMTGKSVDEIEGETVTDMLEQLVAVYQGGETNSPKALTLNFERKEVEQYGLFVVGENNTMSASLELNDGTVIPAKIVVKTVE